jgi:hypothetical protein
MPDILTGSYSEDFEPYASESYQDQEYDSEEDSDEERAQVSSPFGCQNTRSMVKWFNH